MIFKYLGFIASDMKIAVLEPYIEGIGGAQRVIADYATFLAERGHDLEIFTQRYNRDSAYPEFKKFKITLLKPSSKFFIPFIFLFKKFKGFDAIIANDWPSNFASIRNKKVLWICYTPKRDFYDLEEYYIKKDQGYKKRVFRKIKKIMFKGIDRLSAEKSDLISCASKNVSSRIKKYYGINPEVINHGIFFNKYKQGKDKGYFLVASRFVAPKRVDLAIKAMGHVKNKKAKLIVVGDGEEKGKIIELCRKYKNVEFLGKVSDKKLVALYSNCRAIVYVPVNEDWGLAPIEAAASGKATIGANEGGLRETILDGKTGYLIDGVNEKKIAEKIDELAWNPWLARKMGMEALKNSKKFDWNNLLPELEEELIKISGK